MLWLIFVFGLVVGSFLNALIYRFSTSSRSILERHSICPHCQHELAWRDLIPVASFFVLGRRCRYCRQPISWQYPAVELATAVTFTLIYLNSVIPAEAGIQSGSPIGSGMIMSLIFQFVFASLLIVIFVYDLKHYLILDKVVYPAAVLAMVYQIIQGRVLDGIYGALALSGFFLGLYLLTRGRGIGFGDVKLGLFLGFLIPFPETVALFFLAYLSGALVSGALMALGLKTLKDRVPFGTFLTFSAFIAMLWGTELTQWYFHLIGI